MHKGLIGNYILMFYDIHVTQKKFIGEFHNLLVLKILPKKKSGIRSILKNSKDVSKVLTYNFSGTF